MADDVFSGQVLIGGAPVAGSTVTLWSAGPGAPKQLERTRTSADGRFEIRSFFHGDQTNFDLYLTASGGRAGSGAKDDPALVLLTVLGNRAPAKVVINELTTVASAFTNARFISGDTIWGIRSGFASLLGNVPNLVDPQTGTWGNVLLDPLNSTQNTTLANLNTLGSLITAFGTLANDGWRERFLKASTPTGGPTPANTLQAMAGIARESSGPTRRTSIPCSTRPTRSQRMAPGVLRHSFRTSLTLRRISRSCSPSRAVGMFANGRFMFDAAGNLLERSELDAGFAVRRRQ